MARRILRTVLESLVIPTLALAVWLLVISLGRVNAIVLPSPGEVLRSIGTLFTSGGVAGDIGWTLIRTLLGFAAGAVCGILLGAAMGSWRPVHNIMVFPVDALRSVPATALFPLFMLLLGLGLKSMVALIAYPCCWIVTINTMYGVRNSSHVRREMAEIFRLSKFQRFFAVTLPDAVPSIAAGLRLSVAIALHMTIVGEMFLGTTVGLGRRIFDSHMLMRIPDMYAAILVAGLLGYLVNVLFVALERRVSFWGGRT